jgi:DNA mismatch repair protein MutL
MTEPRIWILPPEVAERIAAGEVVERPASVVKELVENALDAGAARITVETEGGGKVLLRITDDGCGMTPEEVGIALQRHATSKLRTADDLFEIRTLGFRGEALPSIAAVSELEILTRPRGSPEGARILVEGGQVLLHSVAAAPVGTSVTVQRLFFNVPVREKFLRADTTEAGAITEWLQRLALSRPDVSFRLVHDGREALLSAGTREPLNAVVAILGRAVAREMLRIPEAEPGPDGVRLRGFIGRPTLTRSSRSSQHTYVNGRAVRSPVFYRALDDAFRATMSHGRYPVALLFLELPPDAVDVNVHPAKIEVRFRDEGAVHAAVARALRAALRTAAVPELEPELGASIDASGAGAVAEPEVRTTVRSVAAPRLFEPPPEVTRPPSPLTGSLAPQVDPLPRAGWETDPFDDPSDRVAPPGVGPAPPPTPFADAALAGGGAPYRHSPVPAAPTRPATSSSAAPAVTRPASPFDAELVLLGQIQDLFILAESDGVLWVIDQHVAHERVLFDRLTAEEAQEAPEALLIPAVVDTTAAQTQALQENREVLAGLGFEVEPFGRDRFALRAVPRSLVGRNYEAAFRDLVEELADRSHGGAVRLLPDEVAAAAAGRSCKSAVKAGRPLSRPEMEALLRDLRSARNPHTCPHGRPIYLTFGQSELAGLFGSRSCEPV